MFPMQKRTGWLDAYGRTQTCRGVLGIFARSHIRRVNTCSPHLIIAAGSLFFHECLFNETDNGHQYTAANAAAGHTSDDTADIESATARAKAEQSEQLAANPAPQYPGNGIAHGAEGVLLHKGTGDVSADSSADKLNDDG
jgi:hypothetical protein